MPRTGIVLLLAAVTLFGTIYSRVKPNEAIPTLSQGRNANVTLVLDAGHGGEDGGAVSPSGIPESAINLAIVLKTEGILGLYGVCPVVLRREDISLHDSTAETLREKKRSDLENRLAAVEGEGSAVLISIHQNSYPDNRYHGFQAFYAPTSGSAELAEHIQQAVCSNLQPENTRVSKQIPDTVYLMNHVTCPAVLLECGFLTNPEEETLLKTPGYQTKMAAAITAAWLSAPIK